MGNGRVRPIRPQAPVVRLDPLTAAGADEIEHWFDHPEVQARLGDRPWIHREVRLLDERPGTCFRGATVLRSQGWIARDHAGAAVAHIGGDVYDRWVRYHGEGPDGPILSDADQRPAMGLAYLVDPDRWRRGYGRAVLQAVFEHPETAEVEIFFLGIDADNHASRRCAEAAGFRLPDLVPDHEDVLYYRHDRSAASSVTAG
jgi:RimJ/RimL family protein N-acetyltransferase